MSIRIYYDNTKYRFKGWRKTVNLIEKVIRSENMVSGDLSFIITSDEVLRKINIEFLNHNYYTAKESRSEASLLRTLLSYPLSEINAQY